MESLPNLIEKALTDIAEGDAWAVNQGLCADLADIVSNTWAGQPGAEADDLQVVNGLSVKYWRLSLFEDDRNHPDWSEDQAPTASELAWLTAAEPPAGIDWHDLDILGFHENSLNHFWLLLNGRHYDAEAPNGVDDLFDLPIVRRVLVQLLTDRRPGLLADLVATHPWWADSLAHNVEWEAWWAVAEATLGTADYEPERRPAAMEAPVSMCSFKS